MTNDIKVKIGIIGGSGLDNPKILTKIKEKKINTPYGKPADNLILGKINQQEVVILARHGKKHNLPPHKIPFRANIWALKKEGCTHILATSACGSLKEEIKPGDFIFIDQFIDFTKQRNLTFFDNKAVHTSLKEPFNKGLRTRLMQSARKLNLRFHPKGTVITIEGPRFSTKAESFLFRSFGADVINMTTVPEVILANELGIPYQTIAVSTDYDSWKENEEAVTFEMILERMKENAEKVKKLLIKTIIEFVNNY